MSLARRSRVVDAARVMTSCFSVFVVQHIAGAEVALNYLGTYFLTH
jgi:hypothetical protein